MTQYMQEAGAMKQADTMRAEFEAWLEADAMPSEADWFKRDPTDPAEYDSSITHFAWKAWQAALAAALPPAAVHPNHLPDLRYVLGALEKAFPSHKKDSLRGELEAAIKGMRYIIKRTEEAAANEGTLTAGKQGGDGVPAPAPAAPSGFPCHARQGWCSTPVACRDHGSCPHGVRGTATSDREPS